ncbi:MAG: helix-turn-helix domain-containing protein [Chloroflexota bacterium]
MDQWLSLSQAASLLGVHFTTLRRWADQGLIEHIRTPGGRRKFNQKAIEDFLARYRQIVALPVELEEIKNEAITKTRQNLQSEIITHQKWYLQMNDAMRQNLRATGQRLIALLFQFCGRESNGEAFLREGEIIAAEYGQVCKSMGLSLSECIQTFLFFRQSMLNSIHETGTIHGIPDIESQRLFERVNFFLDRVLIEMAKQYE